MLTPAVNGSYESASIRYRHVQVLILWMVVPRFQDIFYDNDVETLVNSLVSLLEPLMVIILGCMVGFIVIALFMPLIRIISMMTG